MCEESFHGQWRFKKSSQRVCVVVVSLITVASWECLAEGNDGHAVGPDSFGLRLIFVCLCECVPWQWSGLLGAFQSRFLKGHDLVWLRGRSWELPADWVADIWISASAAPSNILTDSHGTFIINILITKESLLVLVVKRKTKNLEAQSRRPYFVLRLYISHFSLNTMLSKWQTVGED